MEVKFIAENEELFPKYELDGDSGFNLYAKGDITIPAFSLSNKIMTGLRVELPKGYTLQVKGKSGNNSKTSLRVLEGTIDSNYRGEIAVLVDNFSANPFLIERGKAIAQGLIHSIEQVKFVSVEELSNSNRGANGFGSTGTGVND